MNKNRFIQKFKSKSLKEIEVLYNDKERLSQDAITAIEYFINNPDLLKEDTNQTENSIQYTYQTTFKKPIIKYLIILFSTFNSLALFQIKTLRKEYIIEQPVFLILFGIFNLLILIVILRKKEKLGMQLTYLGFSILLLCSVAYINFYIIDQTRNHSFSINDINVPFIAFWIVISIKPEFLLQTEKISTLRQEF